MQKNKYSIHKLIIPNILYCLFPPGSKYKYIILVALPTFFNIQSSGVTK